MLTKSCNHITHFIDNVTLEKTLLVHKNYFPDKLHKKHCKKNESNEAEISLSNSPPLSPETKTRETVQKRRSRGRKSLKIWQRENGKFRLRKGTSSSRRSCERTKCAPTSGTTVSRERKLSRAKEVDLEVCITRVRSAPGALESPYSGSGGLKEGTASGVLTYYFRSGDSEQTRVLTWPASSQLFSLELSSLRARRVQLPDDQSPIKSDIVA